MVSIHHPSSVIHHPSSVIHHTIHPSSLSFPVGRGQTLGLEPVQDHMRTRSETGQKRVRGRGSPLLCVSGGRRPENQEGAPRGRSSGGPGPEPCCCETAGGAGGASRPSGPPSVCCRDDSACQRWLRATDVPTAATRAALCSVPLLYRPAALCLQVEEALSEVDFQLKLDLHFTDSEQQ